MTNKIYSLFFTKTFLRCVQRATTSLHHQYHCTFNSLKLLVPNKNSRRLIFVLYKEKLMKPVLMFVLAHVHLDGKVTDVIDDKFLQVEVIFCFIKS